MPAVAIVSFLLAVFAAAGAAAAQQPSAGETPVRPPAADKYVWSLTHSMPSFRLLRGQIETIVFGDSRATDGVDPEILSEGRPHPVAFNLGNGASGIEYVALLNDSYLSGLPRLKWIVWGVSPRVFNQYWSDRAAEKLRTSPGFEYDKRYPLPAPAEREPIKMELLEGPGKSANLGQGRIEARLAADPAAHAKQRETLPPGQFKFGDERWTAFEAILASFEKRGIKVLLFTPPVHYYVTRAPVSDDDGTPNASYDEVVARLRDLPRKFPGCTFRDIDQRGRNGFKDEEFADYDHLNVTGADRLTRMLAAVMREAEKKRGP